MNKFKHLLVILNKDLNSDIALDRAIIFAEKHNAKITIFKSFYKNLHTVNNGKSSELPDDLSIFVREQQRLISKQYNLLTDQDLSLNIIISWQDPASIAISRLLKDSPVDLIFKSPKTKKQIKELFSTGLDHYLIRDCETPVWMVKPRFWDESIEVLTCLDVDDESKPNNDLNYHILETGEQIAALYEAELHIVDCYFGERVSMRFDYNENTGFETTKSVKEHHQDKLKAYLANYDLPKNFIHCISGIPDDKIPKTAEQLQAELVIIGNNKDTNMIDRTFGDTAKQLTDNMPCDILVLKPVTH